MKPYIAYLIPFLAYLLPSFIISDVSISYTVRIALTAILLISFRKQYKLKFSPSLIAVAAGALIALVWICLPFSSSDSQFNPFGVFLAIKLIGFVIIVPFIEELFTKDFLIRQLIKAEQNKKFSDVKIGMFTWPSFIISVLLFGFSHSMIIAGLLSGVLLNLVLYHTKRIDACIQAHITANFLVAFYILHTQSWWLW